MLKSLLMLIAPAMAGCAVQSTSLAVVDEFEARTVECSGQAWAWSACVAKASALCKTSGYAVIAQKEDWAPGPSPSDGRDGDAAASASVTRSLIVKCKAAA